MLQSDVFQSFLRFAAIAVPGILNWTKYPTAAKVLLRWYYCDGHKLMNHTVYIILILYRNSFLSFESVCAGAS